MEAKTTEYQLEMIEKQIDSLKAEIIAVHHSYIFLKKRFEKHLEIEDAKQKKES